MDDIMRSKIYEYHNDINGTCFSDNFVRDYDGRGCFELEVEIPDNLNPYITVSDNIVVEYNNNKFMLNEILTSKDDEPCISWFVISGVRKVEKLKVYSRKEKSTSMYL